MRVYVYKIWLKEQQQKQQQRLRLRLWQTQHEYHKIAIVAGEKKGHSKMNVHE